MFWFYIVMISVHILICILTAIGIFSGVLKVSKYMIFIVMLLPFWSVAAVLILHTQNSLEREGTKEIQMEKMKLDSEVYRSVTVEEKKNAHKLVPMEEALIVNNPAERRELIMDVLNDNPKEYIRFLQSAGDNDDTEVVHYAVTAMVEISKENDFMLQKLDAQYRQSPDDFDVISRYCDFLQNCLEQKLMQGQVEKMNRIFINELFEKKVKVTSDIADYVNFAKNNMKLKDWTAAKAIIDNMEKLFPEDEQFLMLKIDYFASLGKGEKIRQLIEMIETKRIYLSPKAKEEIAFWKN